MRLLVLTSNFPTPAEPVRGVFTAELVRHLARHCEVSVVVPLPWLPSWRATHWLFPGQARRFGQIPQQVTRGDTHVYFPRYPLVPKLSESIHDRLMFLGIGRFVRRLHARERFDAINAHWLFPDGVAATLLARQLQLPLVLTALGSDVNTEMQHAMKRRRILWAANAARAVTTVSRDLGRKLAAYGVQRDKIVPIGNGVDTVKFAPRDRHACRHELGLPRDERVVVCVARLSAEKGHAVLLRALGELRGKPEPAHLYLLGDGPERANVNRLIAELGLGSCVTLCGAVAHERLPVWLGAADVAVQPSFREGHPNTVMEALASGRPVVASAVGAIPEYVTARSGRLVPPGDHAALAAALGAALAAPSDAAEIAATVSRHTWDACSLEYLGVLEKAMLPPAVTAPESLTDSGTRG